MITWEDDNPERCGQPVATLALAFGVGSLVGAAWVGHKLLFPYRLHRPPRR